MNTMRHLLEHWWRPLVFLTWFWVLTGILADGRYTAFLRPAFGFILGLGVFTLLGFLVTDTVQPRPRRLGVPQALQGLILLLPLAYLWNAQGASLDAYAFRNRSLGLPSLGMPEDASGSYEPVAAPDSLTPVGPEGAPAQPPSANPSPPNAAGEENRVAADGTGAWPGAGPAHTVTILDLYYAPRSYEGKRVKLIGMLHRNDPRVKKDFDKDMLVVFRFVVACCAADASPVAVLVDGNNLPDLDESTWVEVEGTFKTQKKNGRRVPVLEKSSLSKTAAPRQPYLF